MKKKQDIETFELDASRQEQIDLIFNLIKEGHMRIETDNNDDALLLLGMTGSGKSTLAHIFANKQLYARMNEEIGRILIEASAPSDDIKISHDKKSETKIPNKCISKSKGNKLVVWDCPGFNDTDVVQEIANSYYIQRLFDTHNRLKLLLVSPQSAIISNRGLAFIETLDQFSKIFSDIEEIKNSIRLVVTGAESHKQPKHLAKEIDAIVKDNANLAPKTKQLLAYLKEDLILFNCPAEEGEIKQENINYIKEEVFNSIKFVKSENILEKMALSKKAIEYCGYLMQFGFKNIEYIAKILVKTAENTKILIDSYDNIFTQNKKIIEKFLSKNNSNFESKDLHFNGEYFLAEKQMRALFNLTRELNNIDNMSKAVEYMNKLFDVLIEYVAPNSSKAYQQQFVIHKFKYFLNQQYNYSQLFAKLGEQDFNNDVKLLKSKLDESGNMFKSNYINALQQLQVDNNSDDIRYYDIAIKLLKDSDDNNLCRKNLAQSYKKLGDLYLNQDGNKSVSKSIDNYNASLHYDIRQPEIYKNMAELFDDLTEYKIAIQLYYITCDSFRIKDIFKKWIDINPNDSDIREFRGDINLKLGDFSKAIRCYNNAIAVLNMEHAFDKNREKIEAILQKKYFCLNRDNWENYFENQSKLSLEDVVYNFDDANSILSSLGEMNFNEISE